MGAPNRTAKRLWATVLLVAASCMSCVDLSGYYGIVPVQVSDEHTVYFKRVVRGLNFDEISISPAPILCGSPNDETDYEITNSGPVAMLYKVDGGNLFVFIHNDVARPPNGGQFPVKVIQQSLDTPEYSRLESDAERLGLTPLHVEIDESLKCK
ncbi:MAG TPA: hypothetical protein VI756_31970 [Blastocatellia bacterium]